MTKAAHPLFGAVYSLHWPVLLKSGQVLLEQKETLSARWQERGLEDLRALTPDITAAKTIDGDALDTVLHSFDNVHPIGASPFSAFLATRMLDLKRRQAGNRLSAWIFAAALHRLRITPTQNAIREGLNKTRSLKIRAPEALDCLKGQLHSAVALRDALDEARKSYPNPTVRKYFAGLAALMRSAISGGDAVFRERQPSGHAFPIPLPVEEVPATGGSSEITGGIMIERPRFAGPAALQQADDVPTHQTLRGADDAEDFSPPPAAKLRTRKVARAVARRELSLSAEQDPLTSHEAATLMAWLAEHHWQPGHAELMADLFFGVAHTRPAARWNTFGKSLCLRLSVELPDFELLVETPDKFTEREHLLLDAPPAAALPATGPAATEAVAKILKTLRPKLARPLTRGRVQRYKGDWLRRAGADEAVIGFLLGMPPGNRAQMHYTCLERDTLVRWHRAYLEQALGQPATERDSQKGAYGARLRVPHDFLAQIFTDARRDVTARGFSGPGSTRQVQEAHNAFALYTLMILYLATGHRPVSHPFEYRSDFDLEAQLLWISDKDGRGARGTRLVPLAAPALAQTRAWITHLERLTHRLSLTEPALAAQAQAALSMDPNSQGPFFLMFDKADALVPLRPARQVEAFASVLPTALNWTRHILRSALVSSCHPTAIDAFLGHGHSGEEPFVAGSSFGLRDLWPVAEAIEALLDRLKIKPVESPL